MQKLQIQYGNGRSAPVAAVHTLVVGSGAAGLNAAVQLKRRGIDDLLILTEGLQMGTSINTGSDKQTYYKLALCGAAGDSPHAMAQSYLHAGGMHGDLALVESALSARAFCNLVDLGVDFPRDRWGGFPGYKTDHDPARRASSVGPYTSRDMCRALIGEVRRLAIPVEERRSVHRLLVCDENGERRVCGVLAVDENGAQRVYAAANVIFAVGGPGGLYRASVYPAVQSGAIGVALEAGALAQGLAESQFGLASVRFRWNVSGSYMQAVPAFVSTAPDGSDAREFLAEHYGDSAAMCSNIFLKGYQWPFDAHRALHGSSAIDLLVYIETVIRGRRVFLDFRSNAQGYDDARLLPEAREYLERSGAVQPTPIARLAQINPAAIQLYREQGIDLANEMLEVAVCAQHNNGGLAANHWWESVNLKHLFPVGEVNGSHGVARPGGSALNAGQAGGIRAAEYIAARYAAAAPESARFEESAVAALNQSAAFLERCAAAATGWRDVLADIRERMSLAGAHIRSQEGLERAVADARRLCGELESRGCAFSGAHEIPKVLALRQLALAHRVYLEAIRYHVNSGAGSRGSALVVEGAAGSFDFREWRIVPEDTAFREQVLETLFEGETVSSRWVPCRPLPAGEEWFESAWADYREGGIYD